MARPAAKSTAKRAAPRPPAKARRTWSRRAEARPDEILDAALDEFIAQGFDAARVEDIAARAGLSKGAVYLYFESKQALLRGLIEREVKPVVERAAFLAQMGSADPKATIRAMAGVIGQAMSNPRLAAVPFLLVSVANRFPDLAEYYRREVVERGRAALEQLVASGVARGQFRKVDLKAVSRAMIGPLMFEIIWAHVLKGPTEVGKSAKWIDAQFDLLMRGLEKEEKRG